MYKNELLSYCLFPELQALIFMNKRKASNDQKSLEGV